MEPPAAAPPPIKLKISLGSPNKAAKASILVKPAAPPDPEPGGSSKKDNDASSDSSDIDVEEQDDDKDEEEKWLDAVEAGNVDSHVDSELRYYITGR